MKVKILDLQKLLFQAAKKYVSVSEAKYYAEEQLEICLKKFPEESFWLDQIGSDLEIWNNQKGQQIETIVSKGASQLLNFHGLVASLKIKEIHDSLEKRAKKYGIAMTGIYNKSGDDPMCLWTSRLAKRGLIAFCMVSGGPGTVVPFGGTETMFGTNPFSYAIPTQDDPIIADMATSELANFRFMNFFNHNQPLPLNAAVDKNGTPTTDPKKAKEEKGGGRILPMGGGYKGYNMVFLVEILTGALLRSPMSSMEKTSQFISTEYGQVLIAIDPATFTNLEKFKNSVRKMTKAIRSQKPAKNVTKVTVPGDRSYEKMKTNLAKEYLEVEKELLKKLQKLT